MYCSIAPFVAKSGQAQYPSTAPAFDLILVEISQQTIRPFGCPESLRILSLFGPNHKTAYKGISYTSTIALMSNKPFPYNCRNADIQEDILYIPKTEGGPSFWKDITVQQTNLLHSQIFLVMFPSTVLAL